MFIIINLKYVYLRLKDDFKDEFLNTIKEYYDKFDLGDVYSFEGWHYEDQSFYKALSISQNYQIFDITFEKLNYEFLAKHYETLSNILQEENNMLKRQLEEKESSKGIFKKLVKL